MTKTLRATAFHEAGHTVAAIAVGVAFRCASIVPGKDFLGMVEFNKPPTWLRPDVDVDSRTRRWIENRIMIVWAGPLAEKRLTGRFNHVGAQADMALIVDLGSYVIQSDDELAAYVEWLRCRTVNLLSLPWHWESVESVADALLGSRMIKYRTARSLVSA